MEQRLKERLIGAAILVALAVWLIPWVLDGRSPPPEKQASVPLELPAPQDSTPQRTQTIDLDGPQDAAPVVASKDAAAAGPPAADASTAAGGEESRLKTAPTGAAAGAGGEESRLKTAPTRVAAGASQPHGGSASVAQSKAAAQASRTPPAAAGPSEWMVQLGSFGEQDNAQRLAQRVQAVGFDAKISTHQSDGQLLYRVRVGPKATRNAAEATATALSAHGFVAQVVTAE